MIKRCSLKKIIILISMVLMTNSLFALSIQANEYLRKARNYLNIKNYKAAEDYFLRAKQESKDEPEIKEFEESLYKKIDEHVESLSKKAFIYMQEKNIPKASEVFREILIFRPNDREALSQLDEIKRINAEIREYKKQGIAVDASTGRSYDLNQYSAISAYNSANALFSKGEFKKALDILNMILEKEPDYGSALKLKEEVERVYELKLIIDKAESSFKTQSMDTVIKSVTELLNKAPNQYQYYLMRAKAYLYTKNYSEAVKDLLTYYAYTKDKKIVFPLMTEAYFGNGKYLNALAFASDKTSGKSFEFIVKNYFLAYYWENIMILVFIFLGFPFALFFIWQTGNNLFVQKFTLSNLLKFFKCFIYIAFDKNEKCLKDLLEISRNLNYPWLNYYMGLVLLENNDLVKAQRFFKFVMSNKTLKARASFFHGITSKLLKQNAYEDDFETSVLASLDDLPINLWRPWFLKKLEERLINRFSAKDDDSLECMAYKLLNSII